MRLPWRSRDEHRSADVDYTDARIEYQLARAAGLAGIADPLATAAVEACAGIIGRCLAAVVVTPSDIGLTPSIMNTIGREFVLRGQLACEITVSPRRGVILHEAASHEVTGRGVSPSSWRYTLTRSTPSGSGARRTLPADGVVHWRFNTDTHEPWKGRSPLALASETAGLAATLEQRSREEAGGPVGMLLPVPLQVPDESDEDDDQVDPLAPLQAAITQLRGGVAMVEGMTAGWGEQTRRDQGRGYETQRLGGNIPQTHQLLHSSASLAVMAACGVPPTLLSPAGADTREAWRRFSFSTLEPIGEMILEEAHMKLDDTAKLDFRRLHAGDISGRARAFQSLVVAGMSTDQAAALSGLLEQDDA